MDIKEGEDREDMVPTEGVCSGHRNTEISKTLPRAAREELEHIYNFLQ